MATITKVEYYPDIGYVWSRIVQLYEGFIVDDTLNWIIYLGTHLGCRAAEVNIVGPVDTNVYKLVDVSMPSTVKYRPDQAISSPGWMTMCHNLLPQYGTRISSIDWSSRLWAARQHLWTYWIDATVMNDVTSNWALTCPVANQYQRTLTAHANTVFVVDWQTVTIFTPVVDQNFPNDQNPSMMGRTQSVPVVGSGGGSVDTGPIVAALNDIAMMDVDYTANNGGAVWSMRGKVRT